jgi:hypothetical protein
MRTFTREVSLLTGHKVALLDGEGIPLGAVVAVTIPEPPWQPCEPEGLEPGGYVRWRPKCNTCYYRPHAAAAPPCATCSHLGGQDTTDNWQLLKTEPKPPAVPNGARWKDNYGQYCGQYFRVHGRRVQWQRGTYPWEPAAGYLAGEFPSSVAAMWALDGCALSNKWERVEES